MEAEVKPKCKDCTFFVLSSEGVEVDRCEFFDRDLTREEIVVGTDCPEFILREEGRHVEHYLPDKEKTKAGYRREYLKYTVAATVLVIIGIVFLIYISTSP
ncbi:MAG: hypothetical protein ACE5PM_08595 [Candidatus Hydrothermarchaeales archaeon]